jgi:FAD/FMN-containing dehydrogenase
MGRSYGDSCLNADGHLLLSKWLNRWYLFDDITGRIRVESGVTIEDILRLCVRRGWFLPVTPGTKFVTVGGAIANDVHGKNHYREGSFGNHISQLELLRSDGTRILCGPNRNLDWFRATVGGLGLTGMILWAEFHLKPISSPYMVAETVRFQNLNEFFSISDQSVRDFEYTVSWVDCLTRGSSFGRGFLIRGNHASNCPSAPNLTKNAHSITFPFDAPEFVLSSKTIAAFNSIFFQRHPSSKRPELVHYDSFYYPLDKIDQWNRMYGKRGLVQWQCVVPLCGGKNAIKSILGEITRSRRASFLVTLKAFGPVQPVGMLSFPMQGFTLGLDFANSGQDLFDLLHRLDRLVIAYGGRIYPAKDSRMSSSTFHASFSEIGRFSRYIDPKFSSSFYRRVTEQPAFSTCETPNTSGGLAYGLANTS